MSDVAILAPAAETHDEVPVSEVVAALSHALDLTEGQPVGHAGRSCAIALRLARDLALPPDDLDALYFGMLLKDSGCSSSAARMTEIFGGRDDLELKRAGKLIDFGDPRAAMRYVRENVGGHSSLARARQILTTTLAFAKVGGEIVETRCDRGARIVAQLGFPDAASEMVRCLDEHWDGRGRPQRLAGDAIPILARIACLAQTVDVFLIAFGREQARTMARERSNRWFDPQVVDAFLAIGDHDVIWEQLRAALDPAVIAGLRPGLTRRATDDDLDRIANAFADVIDAKSPYTFDHSAGVARYALAIAAALDLAPEQLRMIRRAGLLHDIGKLGVPNSILDKPERLDAAEIRIVQMHPRYTEEILARVSAFAPLARLAGAHHERLDGTGYHRGLGAAQLSLQARIIAVADVFEAMTADRPYRDGLPLEHVLVTLRRDAGTVLDRDSVEVLDAFVQREGLIIPGTPAWSPVV